MIPEVWLSHKKEKPHRLTHDAYKGLVRAAFTVCARDKQKCLNTAGTQELIVNVLRSRATRYHCAVTVFVVMPDHLHLVLKGESEDADLYRCVVQFKRCLAYDLGPGFWQSDFYDHIIRDRLDLARQVMYVLMNPVRRGIVTEWREYSGSGSLTGSLEEIMQFARDMKQQAEREGRKW